MSCGVAPRCRLHGVYTDAAITVRGYGEDGCVVVPPDGMFGMGRASVNDVVIPAEIGGRRTFGIFWRAPDWMFKVNNEWAIAIVDDDEIPRGTFESRILYDGSEVEILHCHDRHVIHRFRVELG